MRKNTAIVLSVFMALAVVFYEPLLSGFYTMKLIYIRKEYPKVMSTTETLREILSGKSIARFGDGELQLIMGGRLVREGEKDEYQVYSKQLSDRLRRIIKSPTENCVIAINNFCDKWNDKELDGSKFSWWETFWLKYWKKLKSIYKEGYTYGCSEVTRIMVFKENSLEDIKKIWDKKKVLFVVGNNSYFVYEKRLFDNIKNAKLLVVPGKSSFNKYDSILDTIMTFDKEYLVLLSLGPCATVLAYDLSKEGYQALDIGHLPNSYLEATGERKKPEEENAEERRFSVKEGIYDLNL
ncbi:MAG: GT-D fold domain-containing protein [Alphaproteobacteria bacterium]|nr:GT-D fold domain-containing protein [Alphaproteobacteria bacterium]